MCVITCLTWWGIVSMLRFRSASSGLGVMSWADMSDSTRKMLTQYFWMWSHFHIMWNKSPLVVVHLQHVSGVLELNAANLDGVKYHLRDSFWVSSHSAEHFVAL